MQKKGDELLDHVVIVLEKLGGKLTISQKEIEDCRSKNLQVVQLEHNKGVSLAILDLTKSSELLLQPISPNWGAAQNTG